VKTKYLIALFWQEHGSKSFSLTTLVECLFLLHWDGNFIENWQRCSLGAVMNGIMSFFLQKANKIVLVRWGKFLC
jgi:hypothetical protein